MDKQKDAQYKPANSVLVFLGLSGKLIFLRIIGFIGVIAAFILLLSGYTTEGTILLWALLVFEGIFYFVKRKQFIKDYQNVKIGNVPLMPAQSQDFPLKDSIIIICIILIAIVFLFFFANPILNL